jgi:hypothetical protein
MGGQVSAISGQVSSVNGRAAKARGQGYVNPIQNEISRGDGRGWCVQAYGGRHPVRVVLVVVVLAGRPWNIV